MRIEWDPSKSAANLRKHGISFEEAATVIFDPFALTVIDVRHSIREDRFKTIGTSNRMRVLLVIHTDETDAQDDRVIRIISARRATAQEIKEYEEEIKRQLEGR